MRGSVCAHRERHGLRMKNRVSVAEAAARAISQIYMGMESWVRASKQKGRSIDDVQITHSLTAQTTTYQLAYGRQSDVKSARLTTHYTTRTNHLSPPTSPHRHRTHTQRRTAPRNAVKRRVSLTRHFAAVDVVEEGRWLVLLLNRRPTARRRKIQFVTFLSLSLFRA